MKTKIPKSELWLIKNFLLNAINFRSHEVKGNSHDLILWILKHQIELELPVHCRLIEAEVNAAGEDEESFGSRIKARKASKAKVFQPIWNEWSRQFSRHVKSSRIISKSNLQNTALWIGKLCDLPESEINALLFLALCEKYHFVQIMSLAIEDQAQSYNPARKGVGDEALLSFACIDYETNQEENELKICKFGLLESRRGILRLSRNIRKIFLSGIDHEEELKSLVIGESHTPKLELNDFQYLGESASTLIKILKTHNEANGHPLNIFIFGEPGTGKTEFAKSIGAAVGRGVYFIGEQDENAEELSRSERVSSLMLLGGIKDDSNSKILVLDEADEILSDIGSGTKSRDKGSKIFLNRLLEKIKTPIIWIVNDHKSIDHAVLRRMNYCIEFPKPPVEVRKSIIG